MVKYHKQATFDESPMEAITVRRKNALGSLIFIFALSVCMIGGCGSNPDVIANNGQQVSDVGENKDITQDKPQNQAEVTNPAEGKNPNGSNNPEEGKNPNGSNNPAENNQNTEVKVTDVPEKSPSNAPKPTPTLKPADGKTTTDYTLGDPDWHEYVSVPWEEPRNELRFDENGEFKILVVSDIHASSIKAPTLAKNNLILLVEREHPNLVIFDGDNTWNISSQIVLEMCIRDMVGYLEEKEIPWCHVFGNHDAEKDNVDKELQQIIYQSFDHCNSQWGDITLTGIGNYVLPVYDSEGKNVKFAVWALDSGAWLTEEEQELLRPIRGTYEGTTRSTYDYIRPNQIEWYTKTSKAIEDYCGEKIPGIMAFHIPLQESYTAWVNRSRLRYTGHKGGGVCASEINSGMFTALMERGDIRAVVNGHDHTNDFMVEYGGIMLCYCSTISDAADCDYDIMGGRVFKINENDPWNVETYMSYVSEQLMQ